MLAPLSLTNIGEKTGVLNDRDSSNRESDESETTKLIENLGELFKSARILDQQIWQQFTEFNLNLEIGTPQPLDQRVRDLAKEGWTEDKIRIMFIPGGLTLEKIKHLVKKQEIPISIEVEPSIEKQIGESEKPYVIVVKTQADMNSGKLSWREKVSLVKESGFDVLSLVALVALSYDSVPGESKTLLFNHQDNAILCSDTARNGRGSIRSLAVQVSGDKISVYSTLPSAANMITALMLKC